MSKNERLALRDLTNTAANAAAGADTGAADKPVSGDVTKATAVTTVPISAPVAAACATTSAIEETTGGFRDSASKRRRSAEGAIQAGNENRVNASLDAPAPTEQPVQLGVRRTASMMVEETQRSAASSLLNQAGEVDHAAIVKAFAAPEGATEAVKLASAWLSQSVIALASAVQNTQRALAVADTSSHTEMQSYSSKIQRLQEAIAFVATLPANAQGASGSQASTSAVVAPVAAAAAAAAAAVVPAVAATAAATAPVVNTAAGAIVPCDLMPIIQREEHQEAKLSATVRSAFEVLQQREQEHPVNDYRGHQTQVSPHMRAVLVDWMREVAAEHKIHDDTYFLAVRLVDRLLTVVPVPRRELQLVGAVCVLLAAKLEEMHPLPINNFEFLCDRLYNRAQFLTMENVIMRKLGYQLHPPFVHKFIGELISGLNYGTRIRHICDYVSFVTVLDYTLSTCASPSLVAAAIVACVANSELGTARPLFNLLPVWCHGEIARLAQLVAGAWRRFHDRWCTEGPASPNIPAEPLPAGPQGQEIPLCRSAFERFNTEEKGHVSTTMVRLNPVFEGIVPVESSSEPEDHSKPRA